MPKTAKLETTRGTIRLNLFEKEAPKTVANFVDLAKKGFYDGTTFHRVIKDFMIQGGDPLSKTLPAGNPRIGTGGPGYKIQCETAGNPQKHTPGTLSMAHAGRDTGGSQFFITHRATPHLDGVHTVFGRVQGLDDQKVVNAIVANDKIVKVTIEETAG
jgi:peptidyl-prolyl cis-trans isomerase B (cyclophilin B)